MPGLVPVVTEYVCLIQRFYPSLPPQGAQQPDPETLYVDQRALRVDRLAQWGGGGGGPVGQVLGQVTVCAVYTLHMWGGAACGVLVSGECSAEERGPFFCSG